MQGPPLIRATGRISGDVRAGLSRWIMGRWSVLVARWSYSEFWILDAIPRVGDAVGRPARRRSRLDSALPPPRDGGWELCPWRHQILPLTTPQPTWGHHCGLSQQLGPWQHCKGANPVTLFHGLATPSGGRHTVKNDGMLPPGDRGWKLGPWHHWILPLTEVSMFTHYKDMKGDEKCKSWGGLWVRAHPRSLEISPFDRTHMTSYSTLIETMRLSSTLFELLSLVSQNLNVTWPWPHPFKGQSVISMLKHHMMNQCTKFEVSSFSRSGDILGGINN